MTNASRRSELREFLRSRRAAVAPRDIGLSPAGRRLVPGLRREEVATLAGVGLTWYTWLEQGRDIQPSPELLSRISRALRLDAADEAYLRSLVANVKSVDPALSQLGPGILGVMDLYPAPAFVHDSLSELLAHNALAARVYGFGSPALGSDPDDEEFTDNILWQTFVDPERRRLYADYEQMARLFVAGFRVSSAAHADQPRHRHLVAALERRSSDFHKLWNQRETKLPLQPFTVHLTHPELGELHVRSVRYPVVDAPGAAAVFLVPTDEHTRDAFLSAAGICAPEGP